MEWKGRSDGTAREGAAPCSATKCQGNETREPVGKQSSGARPTGSRAMGGGSGAAPGKGNSQRSRTCFPTHAGIRVYPQARTAIPHGTGLHSLWSSGRDGIHRRCPPCPHVPRSRRIPHGCRTHPSPFPNQWVQRERLREAAPCVTAP